MTVNSPGAEDTQPFRAKAEDTQPVVPVRRQGRARRWPLLLIIAATSCTLAITIALFVRSLPMEFLATFGAANQVTINRDGLLERVSTRAKTISEFLNELEIVLPPDAALSHDLSDAPFAGMTITLKSARDVTIAVDDERQVLRTALDNPLDILGSAGITVGLDDNIRVNGALARMEALADWTVPAERIEIRRPRPLTIIDNGKQISLLTTAETVGAALADAGIDLGLNDEISPSADRAISGDMTIVIKRAIPIALRLDGVLIEARTRAGRVDEVLRELDASLFGLDYVIPSGDTEIATDMLIEIVRVTEEVVAQQETISFEVRYAADAGLRLDQLYVAQQGQNGTREIRSLVRYENGAEVSRSPAETVITQPPRDQLINYGTKIELRTVETPGGPRLYWRALCMLATSYHPAALGGDNVTAIGWTLEKGIVAADPKIIRYRTEVFVPGYGAATMADTGGPRSSRYWIDLGYSDEDWVSWRRYVKVYLLTPVPPEIDYVLPTWAPIRSVPGGCGS